MKNSSSQVESHIEAWKQKLIDLTRRNRLLYYKATKSSTLSISAPDCFTIFSRLVESEKAWKFRFPPEAPEAENPQKQLTAVSPQIDQSQQDARKADELVCDGLSRKDLERVLQNLYRRARTDYQERGVYILHTVFGMLNWKEAEHGIGGGIVCSPLILCPVELKRETARDPFELSMADEDLVVNPALQVKLQRDFNLALPPLPEDWEQVSLKEYFAEVSRLVEPLQWSVEATAKLGLFSFHKLVIHRDLITNADSLKSNRLICALAGGQLENEPSESIPEERQLDAIQQPGETFQILDADSSQQQCIQVALRGRSLVLQGPPGTGKSQTIANLIAEFIARGKTVLFVSEKMAALEVVQKRLSQASLGDFCLELHSHKRSKREVVAELKKCLDESLIPRHLPTEADFQKLKQLRELLNNYTLALHEVREPLEQSAFTILAKLAALHSIPLIPFLTVDATQVRPAQVQEWESWVRRLATVWPVAEEGENFPWRGCKETDFTLTTRTEWLAFLEQSDSAIQQLSDISRQHSTELRLEVPETLAETHWIIQVGDHLSQSTAINASWLTKDDFDQLLYQAEEYRAVSEDYHRRRGELSQLYDDKFLELPSGTAKQLQEARQQIEPLLLPSDSQGHALLQQRAELLKFAQESRQLAEESLSSGQKLAATFGLSANNLSLERARELAQLAILCHTEPRPEPSWLDPVRLQEARDLVARIRPQYKDYNEARIALLKQYTENLFELDVANLIQKINQFHEQPVTTLLHDLYASVEQITIHSRESSSELLELAQFVKQWFHNVKTLTDLFGFSVTTLTIERTTVLAHFAALCVSSNHPLKEWLSPVSLEQVKNLVIEIRPQYDEFNKRRAALLARYDESFLGLDLDQLIEHFSSVLYRPPLNWANPAFRKDKKDILRTARGATVPNTILDDLVEARELNRLRQKIDANQERNKTFLGIYFKDYNTDFDAVQSAIEVAAKVLRITGSAGLPLKLLGLLSGEMPAPAELSNAEKQLLKVAQKWTNSAQSLPAIVNLKALNDVKALIDKRHQLEGEREQVKVLLGRFDKGYDTDFDAVESSLKIAAVAIKLAAVNPVPNQLIQSIASGTPPTDLNVIGKNLFSTINQWGQSAQQWTAFIPLQQLPGSTLSFKQAPLANIQQWATSLITPLRQLCDISERVLLHRKEQQNLTLSGLIQDLENGEGLRSIQARIEGDSERLKNQFGERYNGINTSWNEVLTALLWTQKLREMFGARRMPEEFIELVAQTEYKSPPVDELRSVYESTADQLQKLTERFEASPSNPDEFFDKPLQAWLFNELQIKIHILSSRIDDLQLWTDYKKLRDRFAQVRLDGFLSLLEKQSAAQLIEIFHKSFYQDWINRYFSRDARLSEFRGQHHEILIEQFRRIDLELVRYASQRVIGRCNAQRPQPALLQTNDSEVGVLKKEAAKKTRHFPVRKLFERIPNLLPRLKPCMMMSPLSVSQFLHPEYVEFDLVIFDEASQIFTEDAVGAIYRANQIIVAGDSKQLPPTNFFDSLDKDDGEIDDELEDEAPANFQSLLDECGAKFPEHLLRWHYRSRHESLIAFSNHRFYDNRLITFPAARHESKNLGIKFVYVADGVYDRGGKKNNLREAEIVTDQVLEHFAQYPKKSLGVIAFSQSQMTTILDEVT